MSAADRIVEEFDRLVTLHPSERAKLPRASQIVYFVVVARCEKDMAGFSSIFEQAIQPEEMSILIDGLRSIDQLELAKVFERCHASLEKDDYHAHADWNRVSPSVKETVEAAGEAVGDCLWDLDEKLVALLDGETV